MLNTKTIALIGAGFAFASLAAEPAMAQIAPSNPGGPATIPGIEAPGTGPGPAADAFGRRPSQETVGGPQLIMDRNERRRRRLEKPEQVLAAAREQIAAAGIECEVTEAAVPGLVNDFVVFETACASGPGYVIISSTPPQASNCLELAGSAYTARLRDPEAEVGQQCELPANQNGLALISSWAREAGVACTVDEALAIGKNGDNTVYEVGCAGEDGYWLEKTADGWALQDCLQVLSANGRCRFTSEAEQNATLQAKLAGTDAANCAVQQVRVMGSNANGHFYEVKCSAEGEGFIARVKDDVTQQIYPCATAQRIGGGCTLTPAPAAAPATTEQ